MRKSLVSEKTMGEIRGILITRISSLKNNERSVREVLEEFIEADEIRRKEDALSRRGANYLKGRLIESGIGERIADMATEEMRSKAESGLFSKGLFSSIASNAVNAVKNSIAEMVTRLVEEKSEEMIEDEIFGLEESLLDARICDIYERLQGHIPFFVDGIMNIYVEAVDSHLDEMLKAVDMESLIREKICGLSPAELERLVFDLMRKELNAIVYLGAFLGAVIGLINLLI